MAGKKIRNRNGLTPKQQEFCDLYSKYAGNLYKVGKAMHLNANAMQVYYLDNPQVKEYLACAL